MDVVGFLMFLFNAPTCGTHCLADVAPLVKLSPLATVSEGKAISLTKLHRYNLMAPPRSSSEARPAQAAWEFKWDVPNVGSVELKITYQVNVAVDVSKLETWRPDAESVLEMRYSASGGGLKFVISVSNRNFEGEVPLAPGSEAGPVEYDILPFTKLKLYFSVKVFAETNAEGAVPKTFNNPVPATATFTPRSNVAITTTFYIAPTIRAEVTVFNKVVFQREFVLERKPGAALSLRINRVILMSNCDTWSMLTRGDPPYDPPRELALINGTRCVLVRNLGMSSTPTGYELKAEYRNINASSCPVFVGGVLPGDVDGDGLFEDFNGNGVLDFSDVVLFFRYFDSQEVQQCRQLYDFNKNGKLDLNDVIQLFRRVGS